VRAWHQPGQRRVPQDRDPRPLIHSRFGFPAPV
jgi:hypothetical protein